MVLVASSIRAQHYGDRTVVTFRRDFNHELVLYTRYVKEPIGYMDILEGFPVPVPVSLVSVSVSLLP